MTDTDIARGLAELRHDLAELRHDINGADGSPQLTLELLQRLVDIVAVLALRCSTAMREVKI